MRHVGCPQAFVQLQATGCIATLGRGWSADLAENTAVFLLAQVHRHLIGLDLLPEYLDKAF